MMTESARFLHGKFEDLLCVAREFHAAGVEPNRTGGDATNHFAHAV
jgi:hypothetical protein